jgi:hypothetical protein
MEERGSGAQSEAFEHLNAAVPELRDMKMYPSLERALALNEKTVASSRNTRTRTTDRAPGRSLVADCGG